MHHQTYFNLYVKAYFKDNKHVNEVIDVIESPEWEELLDSHIKEPSSKEAKKMFKVLSKTISATGSKVPFSHNSDSIGKVK